MRWVFLLVVCSSSLACMGRSGPASTDRVSSDLPTLAERVAFLEQYVTFRRDYQTLDFSIHYFDGGAITPAPAEWDIGLIAQVPAEQLALWIPPGVTPVATADTSWLTRVPQSTAAAGITEWYVEPRRLVGVDRARSVVAYRSWAN